MVEPLRGLLKNGLALLLCALAWPLYGAPVVDDRGVAVNLARAPQRIVTMLPSLAETVCELGACDRLVGVDQYANWPPAVRQLPRVGDVEDARIETIVALQPDLVLLSASSRAIARLETLGIPVFGVELKTLADVQRSLNQVARVLEVPGAVALWSRIDAGIAQAARDLPAALRGTTVYFEVGSGPYAASASSHIGELLSRIGATNIVPATLGSVPKLNPEFVVRADPQVIMLSYSSAQPVERRPGWRRIRAVRDGRVCVLAPAQADVVVRPGPRLAEAAQVIVRCLKASPKEGQP
jgi:iron complex transport system substrate-binding protein